jgi:hypothetical protein
MMSEQPQREVCLWLHTRNHPVDVTACGSPTMKPLGLLFAFSLLVIDGCAEQPTTPASPAKQENAAVQQSTERPIAAGAEKTAAEPVAPAETAKPDQAVSDGMALYRQAQSQMKEGQRQAGFETAKKAMEQLISEGGELPWLLLESETLEGGRRVDVHLNMGPRERKMPENGIVRPLSFRVWSDDEEPKLLKVIDFEIGRVSGQSMTAAIGETSEGVHSNYGILDVDAPYEEIRKKVLEIVSAK